MDNLEIAGTFILIRKIGEGSFGQVYIGQDKRTGEEVAVKLEKSSEEDPQLPDEYKLYKTLEGGVGIPVARWFGQERKYNCLVMDLLGPSLEDLFNYCDRNFSMKTVLMLAEQMIDRLEYFHSKSYIHRDLKPDNMLMGTGRHADELFLIDFGLATKYWDAEKNEHKVYRQDRGLTGTARFASINAHLGFQQSRRDDMEAVGYILMYFNLRGKLPWQKLKAAGKKEKQDQICESKLKTVPDKICKEFPEEFAAYFRYCRSLGFEQKPDYQYLREMIKKLYRVNKFNKGGYVFDWTLK